MLLNWPVLIALVSPFMWSAITRAAYALSSLEIEKDHLFPVTRGSIF
ncbi:hypothetical protein [Priestia megaterium]